MSLIEAECGALLPLSRCAGAGGADVELCSGCWAVHMDRGFLYFGDTPLPAGLVGVSRARGVAARESFVMIAKISEGAYGAVFEYASESSGARVALKMFKRIPGALPNPESDERREADVIHALRRRCRSCTIQATSLTVGEGPWQRTYILMDRADGSLRDLEGTLSDADVFTIGSNLARASACLIEMGYFYLDFKTANVLYICAGGSGGGRFRVALADFGSAVRCFGQPTGIASLPNPTDPSSANVGGFVSCTRANVAYGIIATMLQLRFGADRVAERMWFDKDSGTRLRGARDLLHEWLGGASELHAAFELAIAQSHDALGSLVALSTVNDAHMELE